MYSRVKTAGRRLIFFLSLAAALSCEDPIESPAVCPAKGQAVDVCLAIDIADEADGALLYPENRSASGRSLAGGNRSVAAAAQAAPSQAFDCRLVSSAATKATVDKPDKLYYLDIYQYADGNLLASASLGTQEIGETFTIQLNDNGGNECQLLVIARGATQAVGSLQGKSLAEVRKITATTAALEAVGINDGLNINQMPYLLFLPKVKIKDGQLIASPDESDVRLRLRRLAVGLTLNWSLSDAMAAAGYSLVEVRLMQVPKNYYILPEEETEAPYGTMYPISLSEFVDGFRLKDAELTAAGGAKGTKSLWMPANARGMRTDVVNPLYRDKAHAHPAATYAEFVVDKGIRERLYYRVYLGGNETTDFNLLENTNYQWTIRLNQADYANDPRIQLFDQTPVSSSNLVTTANCQMMLPGTNLCFNPYKHEAGANGWNTYLAPDGTIAKPIAGVKVLWQTKDAGTSGDLVMGYVINDTHHENLVNSTDLADPEQARIHVKIPVTKGGNAVIAAYDAAHTIVWSWHLWISGYVPALLTGDITPVNREGAIEAAQSATAGGMVHVYGGISWTDPAGSFYQCVMMDRNLGATAGGLQTDAMNWVRTFGLLYQGGRKDPIFGTADGGTAEKNIIYDGYGNPLELDKTQASKSASVEQTIQHPLSYYNPATTAMWNGDGAKTIYDPCPAGWRVPSNEYLNNAASGGLAGSMQYRQGDSKASLTAGFASTDPTYVAEWNTSPKTGDNLMYYNGSEFLSLIGTGYGGSISQGENMTNAFVGTRGAGYMYFGGSGEDKDRWSLKSAFFPAAILRETNASFRKNSYNKLFLWSASRNTKDGRIQMYEFQSGLLSSQHTNPASHGFSVRCIQDRIQDRSYGDL